MPHPNDFNIVPFEPLPNTQCLNTTTFKQPPLDGSLSMPEIYDWHLTRSPDHPLFVYSDEERKPIVINWPEGARAVHRAGRIVRDMAGDTGPVRLKPQTFAILSSTDTITYFTLMAGIIRAGHTVFPISPRNSAPAVAHLLTKTGTEHVFVGPESSLQDLAAASLKLMKDAGGSLPILESIPAFDSLFPKVSDDGFEPLPSFRPDWDDPAVIMHSSGSTAFPKPIVWSHYRYFLLGIVPYLGERDLTGKRLACHSMPMYHGMGIMQTGWTASAGLTLTAFKPQSPAVAPTPDLVVKGAVDTGSDVIFCVPSFVEAWAKNQEYIRLLQKTEGILYGGGPLSQGSGDILTNHGISIFMLYGCSECGIMSPILPKTAGKEWNYFKFPEGIKTRFVWDANGNAELLLLPGKHLIPNILNTMIDGLDAYATSDLLAPHPTKPGYWRIYGRADDQIMHNTGEKTNPGPLEAIMNQDPHIQAAVMFGRGKFNAGVIIDPRASFAFDPADQEKLVEFRNKIWPTIERMNEYAPQHSRIFKEMIIVASPSKPFAYTAKNTARRQAIIADYDPEIEALYSAVEETTQADIAPPQTWDLPEATGFVRDVVTRVLKHSLQDSDDFFQKGCDSLQATWIRNSLLHALRDTTEVNTRVLPSAFVYQNPSINTLAVFISSFSKSEHTVVSTKQRIHKMLEIVQKYTSFATHAPSLPVPKLDTIVLTGSTGSLGIEILALLAKSPEIVKVYALNRKSSVSVRQRHENAIRDRGLDLSVLDSEKIQLVEIDLDKDHFGLVSSLYDEMRLSATHIIHNAWPVNFNLSLDSFEPNIRVLRDLVNLALSSPFASPPRLVFISSIGVLRNIDTSVPVKEGPAEPSVAVGMGYSESKWVADSILDAAAKRTPLQPVSVRVGQLTGGTSGAWNQTEWFPSLVRTSQNLGYLPTLDKTASWIPTNVAAKSILEMRGSSLRYLHLVHPQPISWDVIIAALQKELELPLVSYDQWLTSLERLKADSGTQDGNELLDRYPSLKILDFFIDGGKENGSSEAMGMPSLDSTGAQESSATLRKAMPLSEGDVLSWLSYWRKREFIS